MPTSFLHWLWTTDAGLLVRIAAGAAIFLTLALLDLRRRGHHATRWREYLFLLAVTALALLYGILNDLLTSSISWEYFYYGKDLAEILGPTTPPDSLPLHLQAALVGLKATWSAGLLLGVVLLLANNPSQRFPQLLYRHLFRTLPLIILVTLLFSALTGLLGYLNMIPFMPANMTDLLQSTAIRPQPFLAVFGIHLGAYLGLVLSTIITLHKIRLTRRRLAH